MDNNSLIKIDIKEKRARDRKIRVEKFKRRLTLLKAKLLREKIDPNDPRTIQARMDSNGDLRDYYILNPYLQDSAQFNCVTEVKADEINHRYVYRGICSGADNAMAILESNVPLSEIVSNPNGNILLQDVLCQDNSEEMRNYYYSKSNLSIDRLPNHYSYFGNPTFALGTIIKDSNNKFRYSGEISPDIEEMLSREREEENRDKSLRNKDSVVHDLGNGLIISEEDCWIEQKDGIRYFGINKDAMRYEYNPGKPSKTEDNIYVYIGSLQLGEANVNKKGSDNSFEIVKPYQFDNIVLWTEGKNLLRYFMEHKKDGLHFSLGELLTKGNITSSDKSGDCIYIGGVKLGKEGTCTTHEIPESVTNIVNSYINGNSESKNTNNINLDDYR